MTDWQTGQVNAGVLFGEPKPSTSMPEMPTDGISTRPVGNFMAQV